MLFFFEAKFAEIEERNSELDRREEGINGREKKVKDVVILLGKKREEIDRQMEEINTRKKCTEEYAEYLESKRKELEKGFQELNSRKAKFAGFSSIAAKLAEIKEWNLKLNKREEDINSREKMVNDTVMLLGKKHEEIDRQMEVIETSKKCTEKYAEDLQSKRKELEKGFKELNSKKTEFVGFSSSTAAKLAKIKECNLILKARMEELNSREEEFKKSQIQCAKKSEETENKIREIDSARKRMEEYAKELELKQNEIDIGFKELESKKMELTKMTDGSTGSNILGAETSMHPTKRKRTSSDQSLTGGAPMNTELPAPQVSHTVLNQNSNGSETFWTCCASCDFRFQYPKLLVNKEVTCRHCSTKFTASEMDAANVPQVDYLLENLKYFRKTDRIPGDNGEGGSGSV